MKRDDLTLVTPHNTGSACGQTCAPDQYCFCRASAAAVVRAAEASDRAKRARQMREHYKPRRSIRVALSRVDWSGVAIIAMLAVFFVGMYLYGSFAAGALRRVGQ